MGRTKRRSDSSRDFEGSLRLWPRVGRSLSPACRHLASLRRIRVLRSDPQPEQVPCWGARFVADERVRMLPFERLNTKGARTQGPGTSEPAHHTAATCCSRGCPSRVPFAPVALTCLRTHFQGVGAGGGTAGCGRNTYGRRGVQHLRSIRILIPQGWLLRAADRCPVLKMARAEGAETGRTAFFDAPSLSRAGDGYRVGLQWVLRTLERAGAATRGSTARGHRR